MGNSFIREGLDSQLIAQFGAVLKPNIRPLNAKKVRYIRNLLARKRQLKECRVQELNRRQKPHSPLQKVMLG